MDGGEIFMGLVIGSIAGVLAYALIPGKKHLPVGLLLLLGIAAAMIGGAVAVLFSTAYLWILFVQVLVAAGIVALSDGVYAKNAPEPA